MLVLKRDKRPNHNEIIIEGGIRIVVLNIDLNLRNVTIGVVAPGREVMRAELLHKEEGDDRQS